MERVFNTWVRKGYKVEEVEHDYDLHLFVVTKDDGEVSGTICPATLEDQALIIKALNDGEDVNGWEDGMGNTIYV